MADDYQPVFLRVSSVNNRVDSALCSLEYMPMDRVAKGGLDILMAKIDIKSVYNQ